MKRIFISGVCGLFSIFCCAQSKFSPSEFIITSTIKIESIDKRIDSGRVRYYRSSGSGFFFSFHFSKGDVPVIVTNKHVIKGADSGILCFRLKGPHGDISYGNIEKAKLKDFGNLWILHPDTSVDLAILPIGRLLNEYDKMEKNIFYSSYREQDIPSDSILQDLRAIEDIFMVGYPFGLKDNINDLPIVRKGITATPLFLNYNSNKEFLCDIPVYAGSSGSPILIYDQGGNSDRFATGFYLDPRILLLGINYATYTKDFQGKIIPKESYNVEDSLMVSTSMPYNIAIVIKSERLLDFKSILQHYYR